MEEYREYNVEGKLKVYNFLDYNSINEEINKIIPENGEINVQLTINKAYKQNKKVMANMGLKISIINGQENHEPRKEGEPGMLGHVLPGGVQQVSPARCGRHDAKAQEGKPCLLHDGVCHLQS